MSNLWRMSSCIYAANGHRMWVQPNVDNASVCASKNLVRLKYNYYFCGCAEFMVLHIKMINMVLERYVNCQPVHRKAT